MTVTDTSLNMGGYLDAGNNIVYTPGGGQVDTDVEWFIDFDGDGDFDEDEENITKYVMTGSYGYGRNQASQLHGQTAPGKVSATLNNAGTVESGVRVGEHQFSRNNTESPLNTSPFQIRSNMLMRIQTVGTAKTGLDPVLLALDNFEGTGKVSTDELGNSWDYNRGAVKDGGAMFSNSETCQTYMDLGVDDAFIQARWRTFNYNTGMGILYRVDGSRNAGLVYFTASTIAPDTLRVRHEKIDSSWATTETITSTITVGEMNSDRFIGVHVYGSTVDVYLDGELIIEGDAAASSLTGQGYGLFMSGEPTYRSWEQFKVWDSRPAAVEGVLWTGRCNLSMPQYSNDMKTVTIDGWGPLKDSNQAEIVTSPSLGFNNVSAGTTAGQYAGNSLLKAGIPILGDITSDLYIGSKTNEESNGLTEAREAEQLEFGRIYETPEGYIGFAGRSDVAGLGTVKSSWTDDPDVGGFHPEAVEPDEVLGDVRNRVVSQVAAKVPLLENNYVVSAAGTSGIDVNIQSTVFEACEAGWLLLTAVLYRHTTAVDWNLPAGWVEVRNETDYSVDRFKIYAHIVTQDEIDDAPSQVDLFDGGGGAYISNHFLVSNFAGDIENDIKVVSGGYGNPDMSHLAIKGKIQLGAYDMPWEEPSLHIVMVGGADTSTASGGITGGLIDYQLPYRVHNSNDTTQAGTTNEADVIVGRGLRNSAYKRIPPQRFTWQLSDYESLEMIDIIIKGSNGNTDDEALNNKFLVTTDDKASQLASGAVLAYEHVGLKFNSEADASAFNDLVLSKYAGLKPSLKLAFTANKTAAQRQQAVRNRIGDKVYVDTTGRSGLYESGVYRIEAIRGVFNSGNTKWEVEWDLEPI